MTTYNCDGIERRDDGTIDLRWSCHVHVSELADLGEVIVRTVYNDDDTESTFRATLRTILERYPHLPAKDAVRTWDEAPLFEIIDATPNWEESLDAIDET